MENLNFIMNMVIILYIVTKEMGNIIKQIKKGIALYKEYVMAIKKQLIVRFVKEVHSNEFDQEFADRCYAVARGELKFENYSFVGDKEEPIIVDSNGLSEEDAESEDFLLATCIAVGKDGHEEVIDFDFRGDSAAPLDFSMFGGTRDQHYDLDIVKALAGERRHTASYYAFEQTAYELKKQGKVFDDYVMVAKVTLEQIKSALKGEPVIFDDDIFNEREKDSLIEADAIIIDVDDTVEEEAAATLIKSVEVETVEEKDDIAILLEEIEAGVLNKDFLQLLLDLNLNNIDKVFYAGGVQ